MKSILSTLVVLVFLSNFATAQEGKVITKSITIINGDTIVDEQVREIDDSHYETYFFSNGGDSLPEIFKQLGIDSILREGAATINMHIQSFDFDSMESEIQNHAFEVERFFEDLQLDSLLSDARVKVRELDMDIEIDDIFGDRGSRTVADRMETALNKDGLLLPEKNNTVELSGKTLKINGEKQPSNIHDKYKRLWEEETGTALQNKDRISLELQGKIVNRTIQRG